MRVWISDRVIVITRCRPLLAARFTGCLARLDLVFVRARQPAFASCHGERTFELLREFDFRHTIYGENKGVV